MTNISKPTQANNSDFLIGDTVCIKMALEFVDGKYDSDELFTVTAVRNSGISIRVKNKIITAAQSELRHASVAELIAKRRIPAPVALFVSGLKVPGEFA